MVPGGFSEEDFPHRFVLLELDQDRYAVRILPGGRAHRRGKRLQSQVIEGATEHVHLPHLCPALVAVQMREVATPVRFQISVDMLYRRETIVVIALAQRAGDDDVGDGAHKADSRGNRPRAGRPASDDCLADIRDRCLLGGNRIFCLVQNSRICDRTVLASILTGANQHHEEVPAMPEIVFGRDTKFLS